MTSKAEFLGEVSLFAGMDEDELELLAEIAREYEYPERAVVVYQRDVADRLYIVRTGRLQAYALDERGQPQWDQAYLTGDYFQDLWLFTTLTYPATVKTASVSRVLVIKGSDFLDFLERNPRVLDKLAPFEPEMEGEEAMGLSERAWEEALKTRVAAPPKAFKAARLLPEELVLYQSRRSRWLFYLNIAWPTLLLFSLAALLVFVIMPRVGLTQGLVGAEIVFAIVFLLELGVVVYRYLDWSNDHFIITNKHLVHREFSLRTFSSIINKIPIDQVQSVEIDKPSLLSNLLRVGTARITTAAQQGAIYFDYIDDPLRVSETINEVRQQVRLLDAGREQATMRTAIEKHFQVPPTYQEVAPEEEGEASSSPPSPPRKSAWARFRERFAYRVETGDTVTYRKHLFVLVGQTWMHVGVLIIIAVVAWFVRITPVIIGAFVALLIDLASLVWRVEDWRNDTFQLTPRYVIDIDRRPFGFGESRKQAQLSDIQNVNADRPNLLATMFNYGFVYVETAGTNANITFENVVDPNRIQSDIFKRREQFLQQQRVREGEQRRKEYAVLLDVYKQATEQERIPNRTRP